MCYEDVELGYRRTFKISAVSAGNGSIAPDSTRVLLRISLFHAAAGTETGQGRPSGFPSNRGVLCTEPGHPTDEIRFETHGSLVQAGWEFQTGGNMLVTEILDPFLLEKPPAGVPKV